MMYRLFFTNRARKDIATITSPVKERIYSALNLLANNPYIGKAPKGELSGLWSYRVGDYRVIYQIFKKEIVVIILKIGHRREVYH